MDIIGRSFFLITRGSKGVKRETTNLAGFIHFSESLPYIGH